MKNESKEQKRASNIIWNASADYSLQPEIMVYDESGKADLYFNYIIGAVHKYYNYSQLQSFFSYLDKYIDYEFYKKLTWIGLENCVYEKGKHERPVLENLRRSYSKKVLSKWNTDSDNDILDEIKVAHFQRALGEEPKSAELVFNILNDLEFDEFINTEQLIFKMNEIIKVYFELIPAHYEKNWLKNIEKNIKSYRFGDKRKQHYLRMPFMKRLNMGSVKSSSEIIFKERNEKQNKLTFHWLKYIDQRDTIQREYIQNYLGIPIMKEPETKDLEQILCVGNHKNCHLHFTRGEFDTNVNANKDLVYHKNVVLKQREKNKEHYKENFAKNSNSISKLTNKIRNMMPINLGSSYSKSNTGKLAAGKIWRNIYINDSNVFIKNLQDEIGDLTVDIMLDASGSQMYRQETIATEGYIIAESLTRCQIPVRVYSFCTMRNYTVINLFRDYEEVNKNDEIFKYNSTGCNRDGLAIRTALHMIKDSICEHKILIVLSDAKPNDTQGISTSEFNPIKYDYGDVLGVKDTALEVRNGMNNGISILCVFTGLDEDVPAAKKIYGHNLARIKSPERIADIVGVLMQNELKSI